MERTSRGFRKLLPLTLLPLAFFLAAAKPTPPAPARPAPAGEAAVPPAPTRVLLPKVARKTLANGLEVLVEEDHRIPIVAVNLYYHVGSKDEAKDKNGFAHLFEHVMFQGSKHVPEDTFFATLEKAGATGINGTTNDDRTNYFETVPSNRLPLALWLESDRMGFLLDHAGAETFASQRDVVKNERRQNYEAAPYGRVSEFARAALWPEAHPYHRLTIGTPEDLDRASIADVQAFFRTWYVPNNASLSIVGDTTPAEAFALAETYFGAIPSGKLPPRAVPALPVPARSRQLTVEADVTSARVQFAWVSPAMFAPGDAELDLAASVLAAGASTRLEKTLVYDKKLANSVSVHQASRQYGSDFWISVDLTTPNALPATTAAVLAALDELATRGPSADELTRAKTRYRTMYLASLEQASARANQRNLYLQFLGDPDAFERDMQRYEQATVEGVKNAVATWLPAKGRLVVNVIPTPGAGIAGKLVKAEDL